MIEGPANAFICAGCLRAILKRITLPITYSDLPDSGGQFTPIADPANSENPFAPPTANSCCATKCSFCDQSHGGAVSTSQFNMHVICNHCVADSIQLLDDSAVNLAIVRTKQVIQPTPYGDHVVELE